MKKKAPPRSKSSGKKSTKNQTRVKGPRAGRSMKKNGSQKGTSY